MFNIFQGLHSLFSETRTVKNTEGYLLCKMKYEEQGSHHNTKMSGPRIWAIRYMVSCIGSLVDLKKDLGIITKIVYGD